MLCSGRENFHYALFRLSFKQRYELVTALLTSMCRSKWFDRDSLVIEIPIQRHPSLGDKTVHSEILIVQKNEAPRIFKNMPHIEKILRVIHPSSLFWDPKDTKM